MKAIQDEASRQAALRTMAVEQLQRPGSGASAVDGASAALRALFTLASSQVTAADALAIVHELQVHQVELEMQDEALRHAQVETEAALNRQLELYDHAPVACLTVDPRGLIGELNRTAARLLGLDRVELLGSALECRLVLASALAWRALIDRALRTRQIEGAELQLMSREGGAVWVHATAQADPSAGGCLIAMMPAQFGSAAGAAPL